MSGDACDAKDLATERRSGGMPAPGSPAGPGAAGAIDTAAGGRKLAIALGGGLSSAATGSGAPFVAATGRGVIAEDIIAMAERHGIPVEHDPVLLSLLGSLHVGQFIPPEMYQAIAELLVFLYDLDAQIPDISRYE
jgi:flagellar biosynthesis protein